jgi:hypothetical protein
MTALYWTAAALALLAGLDATVRLLRDWSLMAATPAACMLALGAALILTAANPALLQASPSPPAITWASSALGLLAAWAFLRVLAAVTGKGDRVMMHAAVPVLGMVSAGLLQVALQHAHAPQGAKSPSWLPAVTAQLVLLSYYCPALGGIAALAWRCARQIPVRHIGMGMRAVAVAAATELALILARSGILIEAVSGTSIPPGGDLRHRRGPGHRGHPDHRGRDGHGMVSRAGAGLSAVPSVERMVAAAPAVGDLVAGRTRDPAATAARHAAQRPLSPAQAHHRNPRWRTRAAVVLG